MSIMKQIVLYSAVAAVSLAAGIWVRSHFSAVPQIPLTNEISQQGAQAILAASLPDMQGQDQAVSQWLGKVMVVNFWATWCIPCQEEIPEFIETQEKFREQGLVFVGIALDQAEKVKAFSEEFGINYPVLVGSMSAWSLVEAAGNKMSVLPYTVVINRSGEIVETYLGLVNQGKLEKAVIPLLKQNPNVEPSTQTQ